MRAIGWGESRGHPGGVNTLVRATLRRGAWQARPRRLPSPISALGESAPRWHIKRRKICTNFCFPSGPHRRSAMRRTMLIAVVLVFPLAACTPEAPAAAIVAESTDAPLVSSTSHPGDVATGQSIFRFDTFGDETFWTDTLHMHQVIGTKVSP